MKYTILLDSSNTSLSVGLADENNIIDSTSYEAWQCQSEHMIPELNTLLKKYKINRNEIARIIVGFGPGSYTGVRIAITIAKVMAAAIGCDIYPISSLRLEKCGNSPSICLINARSGRSYFGVYEGNSILESDKILTNDEVLDYIKNHPDYVVCGDSKYLKIEGYKSDVVKEMFSVRESLEKVENPLGLTPVYMKD